MTLRGRDRIALGVVVVVALIGAFYFFALKPEHQKASSLSSQIATQRLALTAAQQSYATGKAAEASLKSDGGEWAALKLAVPEESNVPALLRTLEKTAARVHVKMQAITLSNPVSSPAGAPATTGSSSGATPLPIQLTFSGGYAELNNLVRVLTGLVQVSGGKVQASGPLLSISTVSLSGSPKLSVQLSAAIYQLSAGSSSTSGTTTGGQG